MPMKSCRECGHQVSKQAFSCPNCGAPYPAHAQWDGWGYEYKSKAEVFGLPLVHVSFKFSPNRRPVVAKGIIAIGQFGVGVLSITQFGIGLFSLSQFTIAGIAVAQFALAWSMIAQFGIFLNRGYGQLVFSVAELLERFS